VAKYKRNKLFFAPCSHFSHLFSLIHKTSTEGFQWGTKTMTEVRKPGGQGKVASVPFVFQLETQNA